MNKKERREKGCVGYNYKGNNMFWKLLMLCILFVFRDETY